MVMVHCRHISSFSFRTLICLIWNQYWHLTTRSNNLLAASFKCDQKMINIRNRHGSINLGLITVRVFTHVLPVVLFFYVYCWSSLTVNLLLLTQISWWKRLDSKLQLFPQLFQWLVLTWQDEFSAISTYKSAGFLRHPILGIEKVVKELGGVDLHMNWILFSQQILEVENDLQGNLNSSSRDPVSTSILGGRIVNSEILNFFWGGRNAEISIWSSRIPGIKQVEAFFRSQSSCKNQPTHAPLPVHPHPPPRS